MKPSNNKVPKHIGIILDGNRRFSKRLMMKPWKGHEFGAKKVEKLFEWCREFNIKELTLYAFSLENFYRPKKEFCYLMNLFKKELKKLLNDKKVDKYKIKIRFIGRIHMFDKDLQKLIKKVMDKTKNYGNYIVNIAMAYGGRQEVIDAVMKIAYNLKKGRLRLEDINEEVFSKNLYLELKDKINTLEPSLIFHPTKTYIGVQKTGSWRNIIAINFQTNKLILSSLKRCLCKNLCCLLK